MEDGQAVNLANSKGNISEDHNTSINPAALNSTSHRLQFIDMLEAIQDDREPFVNGRKD